MPTGRGARADELVRAWQRFYAVSIDASLDQHAHADPAPALIALFHSVVRDVPAYRELLHHHGIVAERVRTLDDFAALPLTTKDNYLRAYDLASRCRGGKIESCDMIAVSSGSTGEPMLWPRSVTHEMAIAARFEQVFHDGFAAADRRTLAVVCFPLGTWVGGMFTAECCRLLAQKGYPLMVVTPGNQPAEIFRVMRELAPRFEEIVLLGYPPFLKDVVDRGRTEGIDWKARPTRLVLAGEVFTEAWRDLMGERLGIADPLRGSASLYGTADGGVLGNETPLSICIRRFLAEHPSAARALFGDSRLPTLVQYDPFDRYFEVHEGTLVVSGDNGVPLIRYHINDEGGTYAYATLMQRLEDLGFDPISALAGSEVAAVRQLPFVYVFGRSAFAVSYYGANVFPEMVSLGLEQPALRDQVSGKFVMEVQEDGDHNRVLSIEVELAEQVGAPTEALREAIAASIREKLLLVNSEFANYVPAARQTPQVVLWPAGHFPIGVKHRYTRK